MIARAATSRRTGAGRSITVGLPPFQRFLDAHREEVWRFLAATAGPDEVDDCFQETFLAALRAYPRLRAGSNLRAWVMTIAHHKAMDAHRGRRRRPVPVGSLPDTPATAGGARDETLWEAVRELPQKQRAAVVCRYVNDLPYREIARIVGCTEGAARQNVRAGLESLRETWA